MDGTITALLGHVPIILGHEIVGTVAAVGSNVTEFVQGDRIGIPATTDGPGTAINGGYEDFADVRELRHRIHSAPHHADALQRWAADAVRLDQF